jgi:SGNH domain (fused to AT3 domains)/Copper resistance protein D
VLIVATGAVQAFRLVRHPGDLTGTTHGRLVLIKLVVVAAMLGLAAMNRRRVRSIAGEVHDTHRKALRGAVVAEFAVGLLVIGLTASLVVSPPGSSIADAASIVPAVAASSVPVTSQPPPVSSTSVSPSSAPTTSAIAPTTSTTVAPTTTTTAALDLSVLPDVIAGAELGPVPEGTPVRSAGGDEAPVYENGCHVSWGATAPKQGCFYGDTSSDTLVVITGDSEAAHWFGAFDEAGKANGWKIAIVTKAGCPAADVKVYSAADPTNFYLPYPECPVWRQAALEYIRSLQPDLVVFPMLSRRAIVGVPKKVALPNWQEGLGRSIDAVKQSGTAVLVLGDTPKTNGENVAQCVAARQSDVRPCGNTRDKAVDAPRAQGLAQAAQQHGAAWVDPSNWMCTDTFCPAVIGTSVVYRDKLHLTDRFSRLRAPQVAAAIRYALAGSNG